jgi:sphingoid base N-palmitoyltransferase
MRLAYALDMAYYLYAIPYCIMFETKRKDFWATMMHHVVTVILIGYSYGLGFTKVGVVVMFLHDVCDFPLEFAKMMKYAGYEGVATVAFAIFVLVWMAMRVIYFPHWVIRSVIFESWDAILGPYSTTNFPHWEIFSGMLLTLQVLHIFWTYLILKAAVRALTASGKVDDADRENDD